MPDEGLVDSGGLATATKVLEAPSAPRTCAATASWTPSTQSWADLGADIDTTEVALATVKVFPGQASKHAKLRAKRK